MEEAGACGRKEGCEQNGPSVGRTFTGPGDILARIERDDNLAIPSECGGLGPEEGDVAGFGEAMVPQGSLRRWSMMYGFRNKRVGRHRFAADKVE